MNDSRFCLDPISLSYAEQLWRNNFRLRRLMLVGSMMSGTVVLICIAYLSTSVSRSTLLRIATEAACLSMILGFISHRVSTRTEYRIRAPRSRLEGSIFLVVCVSMWIGLTLLMKDVPLNPDPRYRFPYALLLILLQFGGFVVLIERAASLRVGYPGIRLRTETLAWTDVDRVVIARGTSTGTVEIGVRPRVGAVHPRMAPRDGETLTDLPMRVIVPEKRFNQQKLLWAINLGGRTHIQVFDRTSGGDRLIYRSNSSAIYS